MPKNIQERYKLAPTKQGHVIFKHEDSVLIGCSNVTDKNTNTLKVPVVNQGTIKSTGTLYLSYIIVTCNDGILKYSGIPASTEITAPSTMACIENNMPTFEYVENKANPKFVKFVEFFDVFDGTTRYKADVIDGMLDDKNNAIYSHIEMVSTYSERINII